MATAPTSSRRPSTVSLWRHPKAQTIEVQTVAAAFELGGRWKKKIRSKDGDTVADAPPNLSRSRRCTSDSWFATLVGTESGAQQAQ